jgi:FAN1, HTH domain/VRR-NUC domain/Fanconi anemia-associated nuclease SAP domain
MARKFRTDKPKAPQARAVLPDPFYYLSNFETAIASLHERYSDLWSTEEQNFLAAFGGLPRTSRAVLVRMVMREGASFRASRLNYPEIGETRAAVAPLIELHWVDENPSLDVDQLQRLLTKAELLHYFPPPRLGRNLNKPDLVALLREQYPEAKPFHAWCRESSDCVYQLLAAPLCERFRLMFFGNFYQDWSEFVLRDLGIFTYEKIPPSLQSRPFGTRVHIEAFEQLNLCRQWLDAGTALDQVIAAIPPPLADSDWLEQRRQKLLFQVARTAERLGDPKSALTVYSTCTHRGARVRRIRLLERAHEWEIARDLCLAARESPENGAEAEQLRRLVPRLNRKLGVADRKSRAPPKVPAFDMVVDRPNNDDAVEYRVLDHLARQADGTSTIHYVENGLVNSLFGLLCWEAIFAPLPGAFFHDFQYEPADLSSGYFYERRRQEFDACFAELDSGQYETTIRRFFAEKAGIQSPFVAWRLLSRPLLESALTCIPAAHLRIWFEWIVRDTENRAGFPDLVQFWPLERRYRMIEVKGPGDRLQDNQRRLLEYCLSLNMPASVCHVRWA